VTLVTVAEITAYLKELFQIDPVLTDLWVRGEASNISRPASGHLYFSLKDIEASLRCVCFKQQARYLSYLPDDGDAILALVEPAGPACHTGARSCFHNGDPIDPPFSILPDLERWHMAATFFVITGRMSEPGFLDAAAIRELDRAGMDVGDHTAHHVDLRELTPGELATETAGSRRVLEAVLGHPVYFFAYPFGAYDDQVVQAVKSAGFTLAYTPDAGTTESTADPLTMPGIHVGRAETPAGLVALLGGQ